MSEFRVTDARTLAGDAIDLVIRNGRIDERLPAGEADPGAVAPERHHDADGRLVTPPLVEPHLHLDAALTAGEPDWNRSGTLAEGIETWAAYKADLDRADVLDRAERCVEWLAANGVTRVRTHADTTEPTLTGVEALLELQDRVADLVDLQVVAFPQDGLFTDPDHEALFVEAIEMGADVVGGIPHNERTREEGVQDVTTAVELADRYDRPLDLHIDETDDPESRFTEVLAAEAADRGLGDRTTASHATAMHSYPNPYAAKLIDLLAESGIAVITNPPDNSVLQGRYDEYPRRRGHTRIDELRAAGVTVGLGHDSVVDPWYHYGVGDPLEAAHVLVHYAHMSGRDDVAALWEMLTDANAAIFGVGADEYGLTVGARGSLVVHDALDGFDALRRRPPRRLVLRDGEPIVESEPATIALTRGDETRTVSFQR
ncbi:MAG: amidohydrolase family protein [Halobacteriaceae archaeon]